MSKGKFNIAKVKKLFKRYGITRCELCRADNFLSFAHRKKRRHYVDDLINEFNQILLLCVPCHTKLEQNVTLTKEIFLKLRGEEK